MCWTEHVINGVKKGTQGTVLLRVLGNTNKIIDVNIDILEGLLEVVKGYGHWGCWVGRGTVVTGLMNKLCGLFQIVGGWRVGWIL